MVSTDAKYTGFIALTWNIEGLRRNIHNLKFFINEHKPDLIFLSEPQIFKVDCDAAMSYLDADYNHHLNSADSYDVDLPLRQRKACGGTLVLWKRDFDAFVTIHPCNSPAIIALIFKPPGLSATIHVCVYLPTQGHEYVFTEELTNLSIVLDELRHSHPSIPIYLRGDFNVTERYVKRFSLLNTFIQTEGLFELDIRHQTYHHFVGDGVSDSQLDRIFFTNEQQPETLMNIYCKLEHPFVESHHDLLISSWSCILDGSTGYQEDSTLVIALKITNNRHRILWDDDGVLAYQEGILRHLNRLQETWLAQQPPTQSCMSLFIAFTNDLLTSSAISTNQSRRLIPSTSRRSRSTPRAIRLSARKLLRMWKHLRFLRRLHDGDSEIVKKHNEDYKIEKYCHRKLLRSYKSNEANERDSRLLSDPFIHICSDKELTKS